MDKDNNNIWKLYEYSINRIHITYHKEVRKWLSL